MALALALGVLLPPLNEIYPNANILAPIMSAGIIVGTLIFGPVMDKFGYKCLLISGAAVLFFNNGNYTSFPIAILFNLSVVLIVAPLAIRSLRKNHR